jgi:hypothetical protein
MRDNRDMVYSNYQAGGFMEPNMMMTPPQGYSINQNYQAYGPNVMPMNPNNNLNSNMNMQGQTNNTYIDEYDQRITKLERQIRRIDQRLRKLENAGTATIEEEINDYSNNLYMI